MRAVVFSPSALFRMTSYSLTNDWFKNYSLPPEEILIKRVVVDDIIYLIERNLDDDALPVIVINLTTPYPVFDRDLPNVGILDRIITVAKSILTTSVIIPPNWKPHREDNILSLYAAPINKGKGARLHINCSPRSTRSVFAFATTPEILDFDRIDQHVDIFRDSVAGLANAILTPCDDSKSTSKAGIILTQRLPQGFVQGASLDAWYSTKLTSEQRTFVDKPHDGPVRLRGAAGTGKTLSMVIKFLRDGISYAKPASTLPGKLGFITHSNASVDLVTSILEALDPIGITYGIAGACSLEVRTIYDVAYEHLRFNLDDLEPLSLDGREGRRLQFEILESVLREMFESAIVRTRYADLSLPISAGWERSSRSTSQTLIIDIMNEFASVLDAESIRAGEERGERYARSGTNRPAWLMSLPQEIDRRFILDVHRRYRKVLADMNTLSVDQMIGDFNSFLDSNRWDRIKGRLGYDALYVDELHLFTSIERQILHKLIKERFDSTDKLLRPPIFMAYDIKQSPRDSFTEYEDGGTAIFTSKTGLQNSDLVQLTKVFRYTPQIAEFLADLDAAFPAIDIPGEWDAYSGEAELDDGPVPELRIFPNDIALFRSTFEEASKAAHEVEGGGRRVAVLCANEERFDTYLAAASGQFRGKFITVESRDTGAELRHAGKRFVFSMPEYVAGLQFDTVYLIHVDQSESSSDAELGRLRQFISSTYLGSSRAERRLIIASSATHGGASDILRMAQTRESLMEKEI